MNYVVTFTVNGAEHTAVVVASNETEAVNRFWIRYHLAFGESSDSICILFVSKLKYSPKIEYICDHMIALDEEKEALYRMCI